tara:strand:+ start:9692 stop:11020 length:1329 start_codon:yes stop_codon:yes gene_type:complete
VKNQVIIKKVIKPFKNKIYVSGDKSISIRCLLLSSIALGKSRIFNILESEDVLNTLKSLKKIGVEFKKKKKFIEVYGVGINGFNLTKKKILYAGNSGTLARSILGLCSGINNEIQLIGDESLSKRDFSRVIKPLNLFGVNIKSKKGMLPLNLVGSEFLRPIEYIENKGSAQIKTCIILSALNTHGTTKIKAVKSRDHTELMLKSLNYPIQIKSEKKYDLIKINGMKQFKSFDYNVPGDISSASFFIVLTLLSKNSELLIKNINVNPTRIGVINILNIMNSKIKVLNKKNYKGEQIGDIKVKSSNNFKSINCPKILNSSAIDEFLLIFLIACKSKGVSRFKNLGELNKKESPRLDLAIKFMKMIGIKVERKKNDIKIYGNPNLKLDGKYHIKNFVKDHRIFMMSVVAALTFGGKNWIINDKDSVNSSFPNFIKTIKKLGGILN